MPVEPDDDRNGERPGGRDDEQGVDWLEAQLGAPRDQPDEADTPPLPDHSSVEDDLAPEPWWTGGVPTQLAPTEEESATAVLDSPVPAQAALPLPVPPPLETSPAVNDGTPGSATSAAGAVRTTPGATPRRPRAVVWVVAGILAALVLVGLFFVGQRLAGGAPAPAAGPTASATATPTATPTPTPTLAPPPVVTGPQPAGVHPWDALGGGECLQPYTSPWEEEYTVIDCAAPHVAQLVYRGIVAEDQAAPFPGEAALAAQINALCTAPGVIDLAAAGAFPDVQLQGSYPITAEQWSSGQRFYYCFVSRSSGEPLTGSIAGPGPASAG